jgi:hypothetical protein
VIRLRLRIPLDLLAELEDFCAKNQMPRPFLVEKNDKSALTQKVSTVNRIVYDSVKIYKVASV